ncbi:MAG: hypothetical protein U5K79_01700 [Cyclobacteriaceae bacterium]|nr:hypothetical protein [Cyclobacteriaceae bacterium]
MLKFRNAFYLTIFALFVSIQLMAQGGPPPGGGPGGFDPDEMVKREKQNVYKSITDLTDDQKTLLDGIYEEFSVSFKEVRDEVMKTRDFQNMRPKMEALMKEKDNLIQDVLNEDQFAIYTGIVEDRRKQRQARAPQSDQAQPTENTP